MRAGVKSKAAAFEDRVAGIGLDGRPDRVGTVIDDGEDHCGVGEREEKKREEGDSGK